MRLYIDLSPTEEANIHGWVNKGLNDPSFAANPWKIVLEERTQARFDQIAGQFTNTPPVVPPLPYDIWGEIAYGDFSRKVFAASSSIVTAFAFRTPTGPFVGPNGSLLRMSVSENPSIGGAPYLRQLAISRVPGDMVGLLPQNIGKETALNAHIGIEIPAGELLYANSILTQYGEPGTTGSGFSIVWPAT